MENKLATGFDNLMTSLGQMKDEIIQIQNDNTKLNEDIQALEKEKDLAYKSFNTETHLLVSRKALAEIRENIEESKSSSSYAFDDARSIESAAEDCRSSIESAEDYARYGLDAIDEIIREAEKEVEQNG